MGLVPFSKNTKPSGYHGASSPESKGRMPKNQSTAPEANHSGPDASKTTPAPPVDGLTRGHDTNYPRKAKLKN